MVQAAHQKAQGPSSHSPVVKVTFTVHKVLVLTTILLIALILITARAGASPAILPLATQSTAEQVDTSAIAESLDPGVQPLGNLAEIAWDDLYIPGDQTFLSTLLKLPSYNESWTQFIAREGYSNDVTAVPTMIYRINQDLCPANVPYTTNSHPGEANSCVACHGSTQARLSVGNGNASQPSIGNQMAAAPIIECDLCHVTRYERAFLQIRGVD